MTRNYGKPAKLSHTEAGYHHGHGDTGSHCGICRFYQAPDNCKKVSPPIDPNDGCDLFELRRGERLPRSTGANYD